MKRYFLLVVLVIILCMAGHGLIAEKKIQSPDKWQQQLMKYSEVYSLVKKYYPGPIDMEKLFFAFIRGFLTSLDPHSYFLDPVAVRSLDEDQQGNYYGIGTRITKYEDRLTVIAPLVGTPAHKLGIMAGDIIAEIDGQDTRDISLDEAMKLLRGAKGTYVTVKVRREGIQDLIPFKIKRAEIPLNSISYSLVLPWAPEIGYINIRTFGNTTAGEFKENIRRLITGNKIKALILDLRGNAGGSLYAAVDVADFFLAKGTPIVSLKGRAFNQQFTARKDGQYEDLPVVVLINRGSASASEIVASALQDNQRAVIIGSRSWGKGLVQTISRLSLNTSVALTTAKYYTPSNKCLQRDFNEVDDYFFFLDTNYTSYETDRGIEGGVIPDISLPPDLYPEPIVNFVSRGIFFKFARYLIENDRTITQDFTADQQVTAKFETFLKKRKVQYNPSAFNTHIKTIQREIQREVLSNKFSPAEGLKVSLESDPVTQKAVEVLKNKYN
ncbi:MAG: S41 family peptidase [Candidatus Aminicenantes bacterium]|nr:MAG: S41 family peptidase [Candidatus Aminicenantes bacterium]